MVTAGHAPFLAGAGGEGEISLAIVLAERLKKTASEAEFFKPECSALATRADHLAFALRSLARRLSSLTSSASPPYTRPLHRIAAAAAVELDKALVLASRCRRHSHPGSPSAILDRVVLALMGTGAADFVRALNSLEASLADVGWLLSLYAASSSNDSEAEISLSLPPIATTDPIVSYVWSYVATVQMSSRTSKRAEAAQNLANFALDSDRNKWVVVNEGGVAPILALLSDSLDKGAQVVAAAALESLAASPKLVGQILGVGAAVPAIVRILQETSSMSLQAQLASLIARMAAVSPAARGEFGKEKAVRPLVSLLSFGVPLGLVSIPSVLHFSSEMGTASSSRSHLFLANGHSSRFKEWETVSPEAKLAVKVACAEALCVLSEDSIPNSQQIIETRGLLVLMKLIETQKEDLQRHCLMAVMEVTAAAEADAGLRLAFKKNCNVAKLVVEQLLLVMQQEQRPDLRFAAIRSVGSLARTFSAQDARVLWPLVQQLWDENPEISTEAAISLIKFVNPGNYICAQHSKAIVEFDGVKPLLRLLQLGEKSQLHALVLLCYLAVQVPGNAALPRATVMASLESAIGSSAAHHQLLEGLLPQAIYQLELYHDGYL